jgi:hypothetical protein
MTTLCLTVVVLQTIALWIGYTLSPQQRKVRITPFELSDTFMLTSTRRKLMEKQIAKLPNLNEPGLFEPTKITKKIIRSSLTVTF